MSDGYCIKHDIYCCEECYPFISYQQRLIIVGNISARWGNHISLASRQELQEALEVIRLVARLTDKTLRLNKELIANMEKAK